MRKHVRPRLPGWPPGCHAGFLSVLGEAVLAPALMATPRGRFCCGGVVRQFSRPRVPDIRTDGRRWCSHSTPSVPPSPAPTSCAVLRAEADVDALRALELDVASNFSAAVTELLEDRRAAYRDTVLEATLGPRRHAMRDALFRYLNIPMPASRDSTSTAAPPGALSREQIREWKRAWLQKHVTPSDIVDSQVRQDAQRSLVRYTLQFYEVLLTTDVLTRLADVTVLLDELRNTDFLEPHAGVYQSVLWALPMLDLRHGKEDGESHGAETAVVVGERTHVNRVLLGDVACRYMGHALARHADHSHRGETLPTWLAPVSDELWSAFFALATVTHMAPKLFDLWWEKCLAYLQGTAASPAAVPVETHADVGALVLPFSLAYGAVSWCAASQDLERAMRLFETCKSHSVVLATSETHSGRTVMPAGRLLQRSASSEIQTAQLRLFAKMLATVKSMHFDGGVKALFLQDIKALVSAEVLCVAPWGVLNDVLIALTVPSAMQLLRMRSSGTAATAVTAASASSSQGLNLTHQADGEIPFFVWASLLRRCAKAHALDEAEGVFRFLCHQFKPSTAEKRELVEIMLRMYATLSPTDYASAAHIFLEHVLRTPKGQSPVPADAGLYTLLIKAANTRNEAMMTFLEACAAGVGMDADTFEALLNANPYSTVASLSRKLPHDYAVSDLDRQMRLPANADAHARREEALTARQKPLYDSTGDSA